MIRYNPKNWFTIIFQFHKSHLMKQMLPNLIGIGLITALMVWLLRDFWHLNFDDKPNIHGYVGIVLGLLLVFRTNTAYDRWWEGRRLFGALTNSSRNLAIKLNATLLAEDREARMFFARCIPNFYLALKEHLREGVKVEELDLENQPYSETIHKVAHVPNLIVGSLQERLVGLLNSGKINGEQYRILNDDAVTMIDVLGGCERIQRTPIPFSYSIFIKQVILIYLLSLPLSIIGALGYGAIPMTMFTTYVLAGIELLAEEIEDPFGHDYNDLDTDGMSANVRKNVREILLGHPTVELADIPV
jgi:ion channel-forming bestrophin family protein